MLYFLYIYSHTLMSIMKESYMAQNSLELKLPSWSFPSLYANQRTLSPEREKKGH